MMDRNAALMMDLKEEVQESCSKYGTVKKVVVYDTNPEGVVTVSFETTDCSDMASEIVLNGRIVDGRRLEVALWDGKTRYKMEESEEDRKRRLEAWQNYIKGENDSDDEDSKQKTEGTGEKHEARGEKRGISADSIDENKKQPSDRAEQLVDTSEDNGSPQKRQKLDGCEE
ncbi:hypothetical protein Q1695_009775 [Nippostrongylus brasiliensis]|nr:hypothetical protein Q1695_009775 [Nippostrongylus brasiliensis]